MIANEHPFHLHTDFRYQVLHIGVERQPVIVIDDFLREAPRLVEFAATRAKFEVLQDVFYPGIRGAVPAIYGQAVRDFLGDMICAVFDLGSAVIVGDRSDFAMVTTPPSELRWNQCIPHFDASEANYIAGLHYLCAPEFGGTSFYRHRASGCESIDMERRDLFRRTLQIEIDTWGLPPAQYVNGDTSLFERTASVDAKFNRLLLYRGSILHSGNISPNFRFETDPRNGRLTVSSFFLFR